MTWQDPGVSKEDILAAIDDMSVVELADLLEAFTAKFNVTLTTPAPAPALPAPAEAPTEVALHLVRAGDRKINVIKVVREITGLGLKEAKELVDACGLLKADLAPAVAEELRKRLEAEGATVEVR